MKQKYILAILIFLLAGLCAEEIYEVRLPSGMAFINKKGEMVIGPVKSFNGGYSWGLNTGFYGIPIAVLSNKEDNKYHLLSHDGKWLYESEKALVPASFDRVWEQVGEKTWRLIDFKMNEYIRVSLNNRFVLGVHSTDIGYFVDNQAVVVTKNGCIVIDKNGNKLSELPYIQDGVIWHYPSSYLDNGVFLGMHKDYPNDPLLFALQNTSGEVVFPATEIWPVGPPSEGKVFMGDGYVDTNGQRGKDGHGYFYGHHYTEGLAAVIIPGKKDPDHFYAFFINHDGDIVINGEELGITDARPFSEGLASVSTRPAIPTNDVRKAMDIFNYGKYMEEPWGAIDKNGNWVIQAKYPEPFRFDRGLALMKIPYLYADDAGKFFGNISEKAIRYVYMDKNENVIYDSFKDSVRILSGVTRGFEVLNPGFQFK